MDQIMIGVLGIPAVASMSVIDARWALGFWYSAVSIVFFVVKRRKRISYGTVFDATTFRPLSYAVITLIRATGGVTRTAVSDEFGRYYILAPLDDYVMKVSRSGYTFTPDRFKKNPLYTNVYDGGVLNIQLTNPSAAYDIPMEPEVWGSPDLGTRLSIAWSKSVFVFKVVLLAITALLVLVRPMAMTYAMFGVEFLAFSFTTFFPQKKHGKWGVVTNSHSKKPVVFAKVELIDASTDEIIDSAITDIRGRYYFLVSGRRRFFIRCQRPGFKQFKGAPFRPPAGSGHGRATVGKNIVLEPDPDFSDEDRGEFPGMIAQLDEYLKEEGDTHSDTDDSETQ